MAFQGARPIYGGQLELSRIRWYANPNENISLVLVARKTADLLAGKKKIQSSASIYWNDWSIILTLLVTIMSRPKTFEVYQTLDRAMYLFWLKGYRGSSIRDLTKAMGINRQSLYDTFGNKRQLFARVVEGYGQMNRANFPAPLSTPDADLETIRDRFRAVIASATQDPERKGCMLVNCLAEIHHLDEPAQGAVRYFHGLWAEGFQNALQHAAHKGQIASETDTTAVARLLTTLTNGLFLDAKAGASAESLTATVEAIIRMLK